jgi:hypothetical protein
MILRDAIIPFHKKDEEILKYGCEFLNSTLGIQNIYIVGSENPKINNTIFVNENELINIISLNELRQIWESNNLKVSHRAGWVYQQLLKLGSNEYIPSLHENYLICDSDIIFLNNPYEFINDNHFPYAKAYTGEYHPPYREQYLKLMKEDTNSGFSFINHHMVINKDSLSSLKLHIEQLHSERWDRAIINTLNWNEFSNISEYDLYGNWMMKTNKNNCEEVPMNIIDIYKVPSKEDLFHLKTQNIHIVSAQAYKR